MRAASILLALALGLPGGALSEELPAQEQAQVQQWLERMASAADELNYDGNFVYSHGQELQAMRIIHSADATGERERLVSLTGPAREVVRDNNLVTCIQPDDRSVIVERSRSAKQFFPALPIRIDRLEPYYDFSLAGIRRVAGQSAQELLIEPRDDFRYGYRLWVDRNTGLLLKSELFDERGRTIERFMFTSIRYLDEVPDELLEPGISGKEYTWYEADADEPAAADISEQGRWEVVHTPPGFALSVRRSHRLPASQAPLEHMVYSDGLASVSVFLETAARHEQLVGGSEMGAFHAFGRELNGHHATVVGEVPFATVKMIGESIRAREAQ